MHTLTSITIFKKRMQVLSKFALIKLSIFKQILLKTSCNYVILGITKQNPSYVENQRSFKDPRGDNKPHLKEKIKSHGTKEGNEIHIEHHTYICANQNTRNTFSEDKKAPNIKGLEEITVVLKMITLKIKK